MRPVILYRNSGLSSNSFDQAEREAAEEAGFKVITNRVLIQPNELVIPRYSALPYFKNLEEDILLLGSKVINTASQHAYIIDLQNWVSDLGVLTPETWDTTILRIEDLPEGCAFIVKGATNSRKHLWKKLMFAGDRKRAIEIYFQLCDDGLLGEQKIYIRKYIPLKTFMLGINDLPITNEYRFFVCCGQIIAGGYYWSSFQEDMPASCIPDIDTTAVPNQLLQTVIHKIGNKSNFYTIDVAQTVEGDWIVIELNDGQMAGLSAIEPLVFYTNLKLIVDKNYDLS